MRDGAKPPYTRNRDVETALATADHLPLDRLTRCHCLVELFFQLRLESQSSRDSNLFTRGNHHHLDRISGPQIVDFRPVEHRF